MSKTITLRPRLNEKTYILSEQRVYVFDVDRQVNKHTIARSVEAQFEVKVRRVNTANIGGKPKRIISLSGKRMKNAEGSRNDVKKAYVTLAEGHSLPFFEAVEEEEQKEQAVQEKVDKAAAKQAAKADKKVAKQAKPAKKTETDKAANKKAEAAPQEESKPEAPKSWRGWRLRKRKKQSEEEQS